MSPSGSIPGTKVVVGFLDRKRERGILDEFRPTGEGFVLFPPDDAERLRGRPIEFRACKAIYFVRTLEGNREFKENKGILPPTYRQGMKVSVHFPDGERMVGTTEGFLESRPGFTFYPADPKSNNLEIFVVTSNADEIRFTGAEPGGGDRVLRPRLSQGVFLPEKRLEAVQRVLRGEPVAQVARDYYVPPETLAGWRARFLSGGAAALGIKDSRKPSG